MNFQGYLLTAVYDLLITTSTQAQILDWKTYLQPENKAKLAKDWQTRLYLYILVETSLYSPEQISMTYWFVRKEAQSLTFKYDSKQHEQTKQDLTRLLTQLDKYLTAYLTDNIPFTHRDNCQECCPYYQSLSTVYKSSELIFNQEHKNWRKAIASIEELPL